MKTSSTDFCDNERSQQFTLRTMFELLAACCLLFATIRIGTLTTLALVAALLAVWSLRVRDWQLRISLVMMFGGLSGLSMGLLLVVGAVELAPEVLLNNRWPDMLAMVGMTVTFTGGFHGLFGLFHLLLTLLED